MEVISLSQIQSLGHTPLASKQSIHSIGKPNQNDPQIPTEAFPTTVANLRDRPKTETTNTPPDGSNKDPVPERRLETTTHSNLSQSEPNHSKNTETRLADKPATTSDATNTSRKHETIDDDYITSYLGGSTTLESINADQLIDDINSDLDNALRTLEPTSTTKPISVNTIERSNEYHSPAEHTHPSRTIDTIQTRPLPEETKSGEDRPLKSVSTSSTLKETKTTTEETTTPATHFDSPRNIDAVDTAKVIEELKNETEDDLDTILPFLTSDETPTTTELRKSDHQPQAQVDEPQSSHATPTRSLPQTSTTKADHVQNTPSPALNVKQTKTNINESGKDDRTAPGIDANQSADASTTRPVVGDRQPEDDDVLQSVSPWLTLSQTTTTKEKENKDTNTATNIKDTSSHDAFLPTPLVQPKRNEDDDVLNSVSPWLKATDTANATEQSQKHDQPAPRQKEPCPNDVFSPTPQIQPKTAADDDVLKSFSPSLTLNQTTTTKETDNSDMKPPHNAKDTSSHDAFLPTPLMQPTRNEDDNVLNSVAPWLKATDTPEETEQSKKQDQPAPRHKEPCPNDVFSPTPLIQPKTTEDDNVLKSVSPWLTFTNTPTETDERKKDDPPAPPVDETRSTDTFPIRPPQEERKTDDQDVLKRVSPSFTVEETTTTTEERKKDDQPAPPVDETRSTDTFPTQTTGTRRAKD